MSKKSDIIWLDSVDSTNDYVRRHIDTFDNLSVVSALSQVNGKGQGDHRWHSEHGANLLFSILVKDPAIRITEQKVISDSTASCIVELLFRHGIEAWVKPPNDIWVGSKKICGVLIEHSLRAGRISWSIIGIGINVNQTVFPEELPNPTSIALESGKTDVKDLLTEFMEIFSRLSWLQ